MADSVMSTASTALAIDGVKPRENASRQPSCDKQAVLSQLYETMWDTLTAADFNAKYPAARLCPLCGAWVWSEEKHIRWHESIGG